MEIFQFIPLRNPRTTGRLLAPFQDTRHVAVFDLEDSFWVPGNPQRSRELKDRARGEIVRFCTEAGQRYRRIRFGVRTNPLGSDCFRLDLAVLKVLRDALALEFLILPKVADGSEIRACRAELMSAGIPEVGVIPVIESRQAVDRVDGILAACRTARVGRVLYGHYDYSLDSGHWPVSRPGDFEYWEIVGSLITEIEAAGLTYVHPPLGDLNDVSGLRDCLKRLRGISSRQLSIFSAGPTQTSLLERLSRELMEGEDSMPLLPRRLLTGPEKTRLALEVKDLFESNKRPEFSFAADARTGRFIPPHEYLAALKYLGIGEGNHF